MQKHHVVGPVWTNTNLQCRLQGEEARAVQTPTSPAPPRLWNLLAHPSSLSTTAINNPTRPPKKPPRQSQQLVLLQRVRPAVASAKAELLVWLGAGQTHSCGLSCSEQIDAPQSLGVTGKSPRTLLSPKGTRTPSLGFSLSGNADDPGETM